MVLNKLKVSAVIIIFLLLLILDIPEFIICVNAVPDEIQDIPSLLVNGNISAGDSNTEKLLGVLVDILESDYCPPQMKKFLPAYILSDGCHAAEVKRHFLLVANNRIYEDSKEIIPVREIPRPVIPVEKSEQIYSIPHAPFPSVLRI